MKPTKKFRIIYADGTLGAWIPCETYIPGGRPAQAILPPPIYFIEGVHQFEVRYLTDEMETTK